MPEAFHARFPVSVKKKKKKKKLRASPLVSSAEGGRCVGLWPMKLLFAPEKQNKKKNSTQGKSYVVTREETSQLNW